MKKTIKTTARLLAVETPVEGKTNVRLQIVDGQAVRAYQASNPVALAKILTGDVARIQYVEPEDETMRLEHLEIVKMRRETVFEFIREKDELKPKRSIDSKKFHIKRKTE